MEAIFVKMFSVILSVLMSAGVSACGKVRHTAEVSGGERSSHVLGADASSGHADKEEPELTFSTAEEALDYMRESGHWEDYRRGILPQMAVDELDYTTRLLNNKHDGFVVVDKGRMKVIKFDRYGDEVAVFGMACAKNYGTKHKRSDSRTPEGFFSVKRVHNSTDWHYIDDNGVESPKTGEYGPRFIRLNIPCTNSIGIHGTCAPWSIGGRRSHGCIRLTNENIMRLVEMVDSGMPVIITPGRKDIAVNEREGYDIPSVSTVLPEGGR